MVELQIVNMWAEELQALSDALAALSFGTVFPGDVLERRAYRQDHAHSGQ